MTNRDKYRDIIAAKLKTRELLELLAEESAELTQASLKLIRAMKLSNNFTPKTEKECIESLYEEIQDIMMVLDVMDMPDFCIDDSAKWERWAKRLQNNE